MLYDFSYLYLYTTEGHKKFFFSEQLVFTSVSGVSTNPLIKCLTDIWRLWLNR